VRSYSCRTKRPRSNTSSYYTAYLRTFSAFHNYSQAHPEDASHAEGDLAKRFLKQIQEAVASSSPNGKLPDTFELAWPLALMMIARK
jgi:hypothetical protein